MEDIDFTTLSLHDRLGHKLWKARIHAYEELSESILSLRHKPYAELLELNQKYDILSIVNNDSNVISLEKGVQTVYNFVSALQKNLLAQTTFENYNGIYKKRISFFKEPLIKSLLLKTCNSTRQLTKTKSSDIIALLIQLDSNINDYIQILNSLITINLKNVKNLNGFLSTTTYVLMNFQILPTEYQLLDSLLKNLLKLSTNADKKIRQESFNILAIIDSLFDLLKNSNTLIAQKDILQDVVYSNWKPVQMKEFQTKLKSLDIIQNEKLLFEIELIAENENILQNDPEIDEDGDTIMRTSGLGLSSNINNIKPIDPFDTYTPTSILADLNMNHFNEMISSSKWKDRVEVLQDLNDKTLKPIKKLDYSKENYTQLFQLLSSNILKDSNLQAIQLSTQAVGKMLDCLQYKAVKNYSQFLFNPLMERLKEKKVNSLISEVLLKLVEYNNVGLSFCLDDIISHYLQHKILAIRSESCRLLNDLMLKYPLDVRKLISYPKLINDILPLVLKICNDSQQAIRQNGFQSLAIFMKLLPNGEEELVPLLEKKLDQLKLKKILEIAKNLDIPKASNTVPKRMSSTLSSTSSSSITKPVSSFGSTVPSKRLANSPLKQPSKTSSAKIQGFNNPTNNGMSSSISSRTNTSRLTTPPSGKRTSSVEFGNNEWIAEKKLLTAKITDLEIINEQLKSKVKSFDSKISGLEMELSTYKNRYASLESKLMETNSRLEAVLNEQHNNEFSHTPKSKHLPSIQQNINKLHQESQLSLANVNQRVSSLPITTQHLTFNSEELNKQVNSLRINSSKLMETPTYSSGSFTSATSSSKNDESWTRCAEVTQQLKERIERMKAKARASSTRSVSDISHK